jgi:hypothetical protein
MPRLGQVRNVGGVGLKGRHLWVVRGSLGHGSSEEGDDCESKPEPNSIEVHATFAHTKCHFFMNTNIGERDEHTILKLELALFCLKRNVSTKN